MKKIIQLTIILTATFCFMACGNQSKEKETKTEEIKVIEYHPLINIY